MRRAFVFPLLLVTVLACTGDPVGEAPSDASTDPDSPSGLDSGTRDTHGSESTPSDTLRSESGDDTTGDDTTVEDTPTPTPIIAGKACTTDVECDPSSTTGSRCLTSAPTPMCYGAKCTTPTVEPTIAPCPDDGVCLDDGAGSGICVPLCYFDPDTGVFKQSCLGKNTCWFVGNATISGAGTIYGRCEGRCGRDADCPSGTVCREDGTCASTPSSYAAIGDACTQSDDGTKCSCVYGLSDHKGYCSKYCHVGDDTCPSGFTCDADLPVAVKTVPSDGMLGNCLKNCTDDTECTNGHCEQHAGVATKTCQPGGP